CRRGRYAQNHPSLSRLVGSLRPVDDLQGLRGGQCCSRFGLSVRRLCWVLAVDRPETGLGSDGNGWPCALGSRSALLVTMVRVSVGLSWIRRSRTSGLSNGDRGLRTSPAARI